MTDVFTFTAGNSPLLISIPHDGRQLAPGQARTMSPAALRLPDTDWHVGQLYALATTGLDVSIITANYSRYVVDLNRPANDATMYDGKHSTGICPTLTFAGEEIYLAADTIHAELKSARIARYWRPYHEKIRITLAELRERHGYALLWDAHSIASQVPLLFAGRLPDLNVGTDDGRSAARPLADAVTQLAARSPYSTILNGRFRGGHITRHYGDPGRGVHALQQTNVVKPAKGNVILVRMNTKLPTLPPIQVVKPSCPVKWLPTNCKSYPATHWLDHLH